MLNKSLTQMFIYFILFVLSVFLLQGKTEIITNSLEEIDAVEGKIKLIPVYVWGDDETEDINQVFRFPIDIKIDNTGRIFIVDSWNSRIQVFDRSRKFIRTIGREGKGPGDLLYPHRIAISNNNDLIIMDSDNYRVQIMDADGKYIHSFPTGTEYQSWISRTSKDDIILYSPVKEDKNYWALTLYDQKGNFKKEIYRIPCYQKKYSIYSSNGKKNFDELWKESISCVLDTADNIFIAYRRIPLFIKCSSDGKMLNAVSFHTPLKTPSFHLSNETGRLEIGEGEEYSKLSDIFVDRAGRIFITAITRMQNENEQVYLTDKATRWPKNVPEKTDRYRLLVFNASGKVIASKKLPVFCDHIYIYENHLFIVDALMGMKIYEYEFEL